MARIITDSTADLGPQLAAAYRLTVVPLIVHIGGQTYKDGIDLRPADLFALVEQAKELPKTAAPAVGEYAAAFAGPEECLYIGISSRLSASIQSALLAAESLPVDQARVIDSLNLSTGIGLLALRAADLRDQGLSSAEIEQAIVEAVPKVRTAFIVETMEYLYKGGRCSALQAIVGSLLKIRPVIDVRPDGTIGVKAKVRGVRRKALEALLEDLEAHRQEIDPRRVFVTHAGCPEDAAFLSREVARIAAPQEVLVTEAGAVISSHCGPGTIGILYMVR